MMRKNRKARLAALLALAVLAASGAGAALVYRARAKERAEGESAVYRVRSETFTNVIEIAGTVSAANEQKLQAAGDGTVTAVYVREGDAVKQGQVILQLDDSDQRYNLAKHDYDMKEKELTASPLELRLLRTQRDALLRRLADRQVTAGFDGVIAEFTAAAGDVLEAKDSAGVIIDRSYLKAAVEVVETDAPKLKAGQTAALSFPALPGETVLGTVHSFPAVAVKSSRGAAVVKAEIRIENPPEVILPNFSFTGEIEISAPVTLLLVERAAIAREPGRGGGAFAERILPSGETERVAVRVEPYGAEFVKVLSGLAEGDALKAQETPRA